MAILLFMTFSFGPVRYSLKDSSVFTMTSTLVHLYIIFAVTPSSSCYFFLQKSGTDSLVLLFMFISLHNVRLDVYMPDVGC